MNLSARLLLAFAALTTVLLLPTMYATLRLGELQNLAVAGRGEHATASLAIGQFGGALSRLDLYLRGYLASGEAEARSTVQTALDELSAQTASLEEAGFPQASAEVAVVVEALEASVAQIDSLALENRLAEATTAFQRLQPLFEIAPGRAAAAAGLVDARATRDFSRAEQISASARNGTLGALVLALMFAGLVGIWATSTFTSPLRRLTYATANVADGDFEAPPDLPYERDDEIGDLSRSFRTMARQLAELDQMKAEFVAVASHELKTPINVIMGYAKLIDEELSGPVTDSQHEILNDIAEQCQSMTRLVSRLMDISRLEAGAYELELEEIHIQDLLTGLQRSHEFLAERKEVFLSTHIDDSAPTTVVVDMDIVRDEILGNLVSNALRFTPEGGEVRIDVRGDGHSDRVVFRVSDTGPGIPEEHREHIFDRYYQATRAGRVGAGLGLAIVRKMAEAHGGDVTLADEEVGGAVFEVRLPYEPQRV